MKGESKKVELFALFNEKVLEVTEGIKAIAQVTVGYYVAEHDARDAETLTIEMYDRNALRWDDDRKIAAFVTAKDDEVMIFAKSAATVLATSQRLAVSANFQKGMMLFGALKELGATYVVDPSSSYKDLSATKGAAVDYVQFPRQTLKFKSGDCDDLSATYCALLEAIGVHTAFITVPGHIFTAFRLEMPASDARGSFRAADDLILMQDGSAWIPVETTALKEGFLQAWALGAQQWRDYSKEGKASFIRTDEAWNVYEPVAFNIPGTQVFVPAQNLVARTFEDQMKQFVEREISEREQKLQGDVAKAPGEPRLLNSLGVLYARYGILDKAEVQFTAALKRGEYAPALLNLGNLRSLKGNLDDALVFYRRALAAQPNNPGRCWPWPERATSWATSVTRSGSTTDWRPSMRRWPVSTATLHSRTRKPDAPPRLPAAAAYGGRSSMKRRQRFLAACAVALAMATVCLTSCGPAAVLFDSIDQLVNSQPGGTLDTSFGTGGVTTTGFADTTTDYAQGIAIQSDGRIVAAGYTELGGDADFAVARYTTAGVLDTTFDSDGIVTTPFSSADDMGNAVALHTYSGEERIVVAGSADNSGNIDFAVARYKADGTLDMTFNGTGKVTTAIGTGADIGQAVAVQSDGKIVVVGSAYNVSVSNDDFAVARYNSNGTLDTTFNGTGTVMIGLGVGSGMDQGRAVAIQDDGKIVVAGYCEGAINPDFAVLRYNSNGLLDTTFNGTGKVITAVGSGEDQGRAVAIQGDGKIVVAGMSSQDIAVVRYNSDGSLDTTFNGTGKVTTAIGSAEDRGEAVAIQTDGKIVVAGVTDTGSLEPEFAVVRYTAIGTLDPDFGTGGKVVTSIDESSDGGSAIAIQTDGKILVAGYTQNSSPNNDFAVVRYWPGLIW